MAELRTFVFTDLVGSVDLKSEMSGASDAERDLAFLAQILSPHRDRVESFAADFGGRVVSTAGDGHFLVFTDTVSAAQWAIAVQRSHIDHPIATPTGKTAHVRISMHLGAPQVDPRDGDNFIGKAVDYAARLNDYSSSDQILTSRATRAILEDAGLNGVAFHAHGKRELKGIGNVEVYELLFDGRPPRETRRKPAAEKPRDWTRTSDTVTFSKLAGLLPDGAVPASATAVRQTKLGNYELGELIGAGGMGDVFQARHSQFGKLRAVKVIKPHLVTSGSQEIVHRFYQEIKAIGGLEHPNIVVAIDSSTPNDLTHYLVMEYVDGVSAGDLVERFGPLSVANAAEIARQAALGLDYIARQGMVHRDIKPSNLMVTTVATPHLLNADTPSSSNREQPLVKILDLGLALLVGDDHERLTRLDHRAMGTAMYMSPEQWRTTSVDIRSDIYSLGCTLYHLLSGKPPFFDNDLRPEKAHEKSRVPPFRAEQGIPKPLWKLIRKMLAKSPDERFQSPAELAEALAPFAAGHTLVSMVEQARRRPAAAATHTGHASDTLAGGAAHNDTRMGDTRLAGRRSGSTLTATPAATRRWLWGAVAALVVAVAAGVWFADKATRRQRDLEQSREALDTAERESFIDNAHLRATQFAIQVDDRFRILEDQVKRGTIPMPGEQGRYPTLQEVVVRVSDAPSDESLWRPLQSWIVNAKESWDEEAPSESWFIVNRDGTQVARAPHSSTVGNNYAHRNYFHGEEADLEEGVTGVEPIQDSHLSAVYRSDTTGELKVAFSTPVWNGQQRADARAVAGVLAMSVALGDFRVLDRERSSEKEVLLVDLRDDEIEGVRKRGLILHHKQLENRPANEPPARLSPELLARIDQALAEGEPILFDYANPLGGDDRYWGALEPVIIRRGGTGDRIDTQWLVIVQERLSK